MKMELRPLSRLEVRSLDIRAANEFGLPTIALMENAGTEAARWLCNRFGLTPNTNVLVLCGPGNNGGDGGVVARRLDAWGFEQVRAVWVAEQNRIKGDALIQHHVLEKSGLNEYSGIINHPFEMPWLLARIQQADWIIDALLGTGLTRPVEGLIKEVINAVNHSKKPVLALDLPSGLDADSGTALGTAIQAKATATFACLKKGFSQPSAQMFLGEVQVFDIGFPNRLLLDFAQFDNADDEAIENPHE